MQLSLISLALTRIYGGEAAFDPLSLFASGEQGVFYDPSDLSTMFQDSIGTTPVTADGQPVGLILDKSKGLALGPELCGDPQFNGGWWAVGGGCAVTGGNGVATGAADTSGFYRLGAIADGVYYTVTFEVIEISEGGFKVSGLPSAPTENTLGVHSYTAKANGTLIGIFTSGASTTGKIDNVSVKQVAGNHASQATAAKRPLLQNDGVNNYLAFDGVDDALATASIDFTSTDKTSVFAGCRYNATADAQLVELSVFVQNNINTFEMSVPKGERVSKPGMRGNTLAYVLNYPTAVGSLAADQVNKHLVLRSIFDGEQVTSVTQATLAVNAVAQALAPEGATSVALTAFGNYPLFIGSRNQASLFFNGRIYSIIVLGRLATTQEITDAEKWVAAKTGVTLP